MGGRLPPQDAEFTDRVSMTGKIKLEQDCTTLEGTMLVEKDSLLFVCEAQTCLYPLVV